MKTIQLTQGRVTIVDDDVYEWASKFKWHVLISRGTAYAVRSERTASYTVGTKKYFWLHREIIKPANDIEVDHRDGDGLNNQRYNLRPATGQQNKWAHRKAKALGAASKFRGVGWSSERKKWEARIAVSKKQIFLGRFEKEFEAAKAYDSAALKYYGEFAQLNFV